MDEFSLARRHFLAGGLVAGLTASAGCLSSDTTALGENSKTELTLSLSRVDGLLRETYVHEYDDPADHWDQQALAAVIADEHYTTQLRKPFFARPEDPVWVVHDGTYYQLGSVIVDEITETHPVLRLFEAEDVTANPVNGGDDGDLPESDQRAIHIAHMAARARGNEGGYQSGLVQRGGYVYRSQTARDESNLLGEDGPDYVTYRGTTYEVKLTRERLHEAVYRPTAEPVAEDPDQMEVILRAALVGARVSPDNLSSETQQIITDAETGGYSETHPFSEAYTELLRAIDKRPYIDGNIRSDAGVRTDTKEMIQYENTYYRYSLRLHDDTN